MRTAAITRSLSATYDYALVHCKTELEREAPLELDSHRHTIASAFFEDSGV